MNKILFRNIGGESLEEIEIAKKYFHVIDSRMAVVKDDFVICRYSCLPFFKELEQDIKYIGADIINSYRQHKYIADLSNWVGDLDGLTPKTWSRLEDLPEGCSFVLKGETNSKKHNWKTSMFAKDKRAALDVYTTLCNDSLIGHQNIYIREYVPLYAYGIGLQDLPITKEFRFFVAYGKVISSGFYWSNHLDEIDKVPNASEVPEEFLQQVINIVGKNSNFYVIDVAQTASGHWIVIELNEGMMSGLSMNDPEILYKNLALTCSNH